MLDVQTRVRVDMKQRPDMDEEPLTDTIFMYYSLTTNHWLSRQPRRDSQNYSRAASEH